MRLKRISITLRGLYGFFYMSIVLSVGPPDLAWASSPESQKRHVAIERFSLSINRQCEIRNFFDIPPAILLDLADRFRDSRPDRERAVFDLYAKRNKDGSLTSCANEDGARCSADENIYGFYKAGELEKFSNFVCRSKNF